MSAGAHIHDTKLISATIEAIVGDRPSPTAERPQHLTKCGCVDHITPRDAVHI
jgi:hypothetical protein